MTSYYYRGRDNHAGFSRLPEEAAALVQVFQAFKKAEMSFMCTRPGNEHMTKKWNRFCSRKGDLKHIKHLEMNLSEKFKMQERQDGK